MRSTQTSAFFRLLYFAAQARDPDKLICASHDKPEKHHSFETAVRAVMISQLLCHAFKLAEPSLLASMMNSTTHLFAKNCLSLSFLSHI